MIMLAAFSWLYSDQKSFEEGTPQKLIGSCDHWERPVGTSHVPVQQINELGLQLDSGQIPLLYSPSNAAYI